MRQLSSIVILEVAKMSLAEDVCGAVALMYQGYVCQIQSRTTGEPRARFAFEYAQRANDCLPNTPCGLSIKKALAIGAFGAVGNDFADNVLPKAGAGPSSNAPLVLPRARRTL